MYNTPAYKAARGLGWFSLGLGAAEVIAPDVISRTLGMGRQSSLLRGFGLREIATGLGILLSRNPAPWLWARVAGDALDMAALLLGRGRRNPHPGAATTAFLSVAAVAALDYLSARDLSERVAFRKLPRRDYSDRVGISRKAA